MPIFHECQRCTACCRWPGQVKLSEEEITRIADHLALKDEVFIHAYTRLNASRSGLSLKDQPNGACIFLKEEQCMIHPVKPQQCRDFPNLWNFPGFQKTCKAIPKVVSASEYKKRLQQSTGRSL